VAVAVSATAIVTETERSIGKPCQTWNQKDDECPVLVAYEDVKSRQRIELASTVDQTRPLSWKIRH
jgi:hypothetical protein